MDLWILILAVLLAAIAAAQGAVYLRQGTRSRWTLLWMVGSFVAQTVMMGMRSELRGSCPLGDLGEILIFSAWSLTIFYMAVGSIFRLSLLGVFTAPVVFFLLLLATLPGMLDVSPERVVVVDPWREGHAALSVMAYGALGLAAVAGVMFIVLNRKLKEAETDTGLFKNLPPARGLIVVINRLLILGFLLLTSGIFCGVMMETSVGAAKHLIAAMLQWGAYFTLILVEWRRGMPPGKLSLAAVILFVLSFLIFPFLK